MTEKIIRDCAAEFARELAKYATKLDIPGWREPAIHLYVTFTKEHGPKLELSFQSTTYGSSVKHTSLGLLMDEVYRRELFDEKAQVSVDTESASLRSLTFQPSNEDQYEMPRTLIPEMLDITSPQSTVGVSIRKDGHVLWVCVDGVCRLRVSRISHLTLEDNRIQAQVSAPDATCS